MLHCCRSLYVVRRMTCRCPQTQLLLMTSEDRAVSAMQEPSVLVPTSTQHYCREGLDAPILSDGSCGVAFGMPACLRPL